MKPPLPVSDAARAMSDAMLGTLLAAFNPEPATLNQTRTAFVSYCRAHPHFKDIRSAWASFHKELTLHLNGEASAPSVLSVTFPNTETPEPITVLHTSAPAGMLMVESG